MMFQSKQRVLVLLEIPLIVVILCQLWYKPFPLWVYLLASVLLGLILAISIHAFSQHRVFIFLQMLLLAVLVRNVYYMATHYSVIPLGDAYGEYGAMRAYLQQGRVFIIPDPGGYEGYLTGFNYSGWPGIQLLAIPLSFICNITPFNTTLILPWIFFLGMFLFAYLLLTKMEQDLHLNKRVTSFALLVMATFPFLMWPPAFAHQDMGTFLLMAIFYLLYKQLTVRSFSGSALLIVFIFALTVAHHYTSFVAVMYFFLLSFLILVGRYLSTRVKWGLLPRAGLRIPFFTLAMIAVILLFMWWNSYAVWIWPKVAQILTHTIDVLKRVAFSPPVWEVQYPAHLIPGWAPPLLLLRDIAMLVPAIPGFILLCLRKTDAISKIFIVYSLVTAAVLFLFDTFVAWVTYYRMIFLFAPFIALCIAISYDKLYEVLKGKWRNLSTGLVVAVVVLFVFSSLTGQWAHRFTLAHFYDPEVSSVEVGEHSTRWRQVGEFLDEYMNYGEIDKVVTDDIYALSLALPAEQLSKIRAMQLKGADRTAETVVVAFRDLRPPGYSWIGYPHWMDPEFEESKFRLEMEEDFNLIYNDGWSKVWQFK